MLTITPRDIAARYVELGWSPLPIRPREKRPFGGGWYDADVDLAKFSPDSNVGVRLGDRSGGLVDIDLDCPEALALAAVLLPPTPAIFGRASAPMSHYLYRCPGIGAVTQHKDPLRQRDDPKNAVIVELRGGSKDHSAQTVFPGSTHPSGERIEWAAAEVPTPAEVERGQLEKCVRRLAGAALLLRYWPEHGHEVALAVAGALLRGDDGWTADRVQQLFQLVALNDGKLRDRMRTVNQVAKDAAAGKRVAGWTHLAKQIDPDVADAIRRWFGGGVSVRPVTTAVLGEELTRKAVERGYALNATHLGIAERMVLRNEGQLLYTSARGWLTWDGRRMAPDETRQAEALAVESVRLLAAEAAQAPEADARKAILGGARGAEKFNHVRSIVNLASTLDGVAVRADELDADDWSLNVMNGRLDLREMKLHEATPRDLCTKLAPVVFDPGATFERWEDALEDWTDGDAELMLFLQQLAGYTLTGSTAEELILFVYGPGGSGKSTFLEALRRVLGDYAVAADFETFMLSRAGDANRPDLARMAGSRMVYANESAAGRRFNEGLVKSLTGGDPVTAAFKYHNPFTYLPRFQLWLASNDPPRVRTDDTGLWRRMKRIPFSVAIPEEKRDPALKTYLTNTLEGRAEVFAWALEGLQSYLRDGLQIPASVSESTDEYRAESDPIAEFIDDRCELGKELWAPVSEVRKAYLVWCDEHGDRPMSAQAFRGVLASKAIERERGRKPPHPRWENGQKPFFGYFWQGLDLR